MIKIDFQTFVIAVLFILAMTLAMVSAPVFASTGATGAGGTGLAWETPLQQIRDSISGPVAFTILLLSLLGIGATLSFGGEINIVFRSLILFGLSGALIASGARIISLLFSGAVIGDEMEIAYLALALRETPIRKALYRPNLILGGDRKMVIMSLSTSAALILSATNKVALVAGILLSLISLYGLRKAAQHDPFLLPVYWRFLKYRPFYFGPYSRPARTAQSRGERY